MALLQVVISNERGCHELIIGHGLAASAIIASIDDPRGIAKDLETPVHIGHWGNGDYLVEVSEHTDIDYVMNLIQQSYDINQ